MYLENQDEIDKLDNCPLYNEDKTITLFRFCKNAPIDNDDLIPFAILKPELYANDCLAWGLSLFNTKEETLKIIKALPSKKRKKIIAIGSIDIDKNTAVKHKSGQNKSHYTIYPLKNVNLISRFTTEKI
jgi:hypothetical protein